MQRCTGQHPGKGLTAAMASPVLLSLRTLTKFTLIKYVWLTVSLLKFFFLRNRHIYHILLFHCLTLFSSKLSTLPIAQADFKTM